MIVELVAENVAILDRAALSLGPGFTVLTGETGAGKSLLIDAIELALGARGDSDLVRSGAQRATVSLTIDLTSRPDLAERAAEMGFATEDGLLYIQRELLAEGRSQGRIQGRMTPLAALKILGQLLVDLHGQHDHQSLLHPEGHIAFLDAFAGKQVEVLLLRVSDGFRCVCDLERRLQAVRTGRREREQRIDLLRFQVQEIETVQPAPGETDELVSGQSRLRHAERLSMAAQEALESLSRKESSAFEVLNAAKKSLEDCAALDSGLREPLDPLREALFQLEDGLSKLRDYADGIEADPKRLEEISERLDALAKLKRKYGDDETAILEHLENAKSELAILEEDAGGEEDLAARLEAAISELRKLCDSLTKLRKDAAAKFSGLVESQLRELAMDKARFEARVAPKPADGTGADAVEFFFSANAGESLRPLAKIASGGEMARLMLSLKTVLAGKAGVPTLIFDEVESGLGGPTAAVVGKKLEELSRNYQVIVISHLPQIAGRALTHFKIEKGEHSGRTTTRIRALDRGERVEEIARMISGGQVGDTAKAHAIELLERA